MRNTGVSIANHSVSSVVVANRYVNHHHQQQRHFLYRFVPDIDDAVGEARYRATFDKLALRPGAIQRHFVRVPEGATQATCVIIIIISLSLSLLLQ
jgi:hypothetical protein